MRHMMSKDSRVAIIRIYRLFRLLCTKVYDPSTYWVLKAGVITTLCFLEKIFLPSFFDLMTHLVIHLVDEFHICGPIHAHWMYPIECAMKDYVQNMCKLEGGMVEGYIFYEALGFYTKYM